MRGKQCAGANGFGQQQHVAGFHAALDHHAAQVFIDQAVDRKTQRQFLALAGVATDQRTAGFVEHFDRAGHHLEQGVFDLGFQTRRDRAHRSGGLRLAAHGKDVAQRVVGRDLAKYVRVVDESAEKIHAVHHGLAGRHAHHGGVVGGVQADQHVSALNRRKRPQRTREYRSAHLGAAAAAAHRNRRDRLRGFFGVELDGAGLRTGWQSHHGCESCEFAHELAVDAVLPAPQPGAQQARARTQAPAAARGHGKAVAGADQGQPVALRPVSTQRCIL